ncbi:MAG TPA: hypothetical protein VN258_07520 [Mobilitalea sp.]|nr:hypothetical protein [Mobilitalea sp.]
MHNTYRVVGNRVFIRIPAANGKQPLPSVDLLIDLRNLEKAKEYPGTWSQYIHQRTGKVYIRGNHSQRRDSQPILSRYIANPKKGQNTRHLDGNSLNCLECNLVNADIGIRDISDLEPIGPAPIEDYSEPKQETPLRGVSWHKVKKRWEVKPTYEGKRYTLGFWPENMLREANEAITYFREHGPEAYAAKFGGR